MVNSPLSVLRTFIKLFCDLLAGKTCFSLNTVDYCNHTLSFTVVYKYKSGLYSIFRQINC